MALPAAGGAFINPCDNPFHSQLKRAYFQVRKKSYPDKLKAILEAYYQPTEDSIANYFEHVGWRGARLTKRQVQYLLSEGYRPGKRHAVIYDEMARVYQGWTKNLRTAALAEHSTFVHRLPPHTWHVWL